MSITLTHKDLVPNFLTFWESAAHQPDEAERWRLWREQYGFAAVPPTPFGEELARRLLAAAWDRYPAVIEELPGAARRLQEMAPRIAERVGRLFTLDREIDVRLVTFVGGFEGNAFAAGNAVCMPVETELLPFTLAHELIHQVHGALSGKGGGWQRTVAFVLMEEGLAMRGTRALFPEIPVDLHLSHLDPAWVQASEARHTEIIAGVLPCLSHDDDESLLRFTMQAGPAGLIREGYWAGWHAVGQLLAEGWSLGRLARVPETEATPLIGGALHRILARAQRASH